MQLQLCTIWTSQIGSLSPLQQQPDEPGIPAGKLPGKLDIGLQEPVASLQQEQRAGNCSLQSSGGPKRSDNARIKVQVLEDGALQWDLEVRVAFLSREYCQSWRPSTPSSSFRRAAVV